MSSVDENIARFQKMAEADPENELGHYSLGKALLDAKRYDEAASSLETVLQLSPGYSKAYELLAAAQQAMNQQAAAIGTLKKGYSVAAQRGDVMPEKAMAKMLADLGQSLPNVARPTPLETEPGSTAVDGDFRCVRCGAPSGKMQYRPFKGELGEQIWASVCQKCWKEWIPMGTKVINELGLQLTDPKAQSTYDLYMKEFLQL